jgi:hypothetical protein
VSVERGGGGESRRPRFPALDPEPPPSARYRRIARNAAITVVAVAAVLGLTRLTTYLLSSSGHGPAASPKSSVPVREASDAPPGRILSLTGSQYLAVSDLRGDHPTQLSSLGKFSPSPEPTLDSRYVVTPFAQLITFSSRGQPIVTPMNNVDAGWWQPVASEPLTDHDRYAVLNGNAGSYDSGNNPIEISSLATGRVNSSWEADNAAGDPQAAGIFASVATPPEATSNPSNLFPDASVQLLDSGRPRVVLASAAQLNRDVQLPASTPTLFFPYPSPDGDMVAIVVRPITAPGASSAEGGVVIVTRTGREVTSFGGGGVIAPSWSPASASLAFTANSGAGSVLHVWNTSGQSTSQDIPAAAGKLYSDCVWSPAGAWILCAAPGANQAGQDWVVAAASGGPLVATHGPGFPIAWLGETR